ncbi:MAG: hemerythrin family protein [Methylocystis sp.]
MGEPQYEAHTMLVALRKLIDLAQEHFAHEEESMIDAAFPGRLLHRRDHEYLLRGLRNYMSAFVDITDRPPPSLCDNLQSWLGLHCRRYDDAYLRFAEQRRSSASIIWRPHS